MLRLRRLWRFDRRLRKRRQKTARFRLPQRPYRRYQRIGTDGRYTYIYTGQESYEPLTQVFHNNQDEEQYLAYFNFDQIGIPCEMTDKNGNLLWFGNYTAWGRLKEETRVTDSTYQPFRHDLESPLGYDMYPLYWITSKGGIFMRYSYEFKRKI